MNDELPPLGLRIVLAYGAIFLIIASIAWFPGSRWTRLLGAKVGPNLDPTGRTRRETFGSAAGFVLIAAYALATLYLSEPLFRWALGRDPWHDQGFNAVIFICAIGFMVGVAGALYLGIRALFRPAAIYRWEDDELSRAELLKTYQPAIGHAAPVVIFCHQEGDFEAFGVLNAPPREQLGQVVRGFWWGTLKSLGRWPTLEEAERVAREHTGNA
jgi:hypothetical protein